MNYQITSLETIRRAFAEAGFISPCTYFVKGLPEQCATVYEVKSVDVGLTIDRAWYQMRKAFTILCHTGRRGVVFAKLKWDTNERGKIHVRFTLCLMEPNEP